MSHSFQVTFDANDPALLAGFWTLALGYEIQPPPPGFADWDEWAAAMEIPEEKWNDARALVDPEGEGPRVFIQKVPEGKTAKNRVHLDVSVSDRTTVIDERRAQVEAHVARLLEAGGTRFATFDKAEAWGDEYWVVMQDPEGNEFCVQ